MKSKIIYAAMGLAALTSACTDELDYGEYVLNTKDYISQTFSGIEAIADNCYSYLDFDYGQNYSYAMLCCATDEAMCPYSSCSVQGFVNGSWSATNTLSSRWSSDYTGIQCVNYYIDNFSNMEFEELKLNDDYNLNMRRYNYSFPSVRALRAYYYFDLVKNFGDVPYFTSTATVDNVNSLTRTPALAVLDSVMAECDAVVDTVVVDYSALPDEGWGDKLTLRVDRYFVLALKARAAIYAASNLFTDGNKERWKYAAECCKQLIDECNAANKTVARTKYSTIASAFALEGAELIFSRLYYFSALKTALPEYYNYPVGISGYGLGYNCPSQTLVDAYEMQETGLGIDEEGSGYDESNPYEGRDPRFALTIACNGDGWPTAYTDDDSYCLETYTSGTSGINNNDYGTPTGYYLRKGLDGSIDRRTGSSGVTSSNHSFITFRLSEFYLNYAEAMYEYYGDPNVSGDGDLDMTANEAINVIRARVEMPDFPEDLSGDDWVRKYKNERFVELAFEGHRFYDLRRWKGCSDGIDAAHRMTSIDKMRIELESIEYDEYVTTGYDGSDSTYTVARNVYSYNRETESRVWSDKMYFFPIEQSELVKNSNLTQNEGW